MVSQDASVIDLVLKALLCFEFQSESFPVETEVVQIVIKVADEVLHRQTFIVRRT